jgi:hypothetical protein
VAWPDFDVDSALERDVLRRALPLVPTVSDGTRRIAVDQTTDTVGAAITLGVAGVVGPTPSGCVDLLAIRPLLVGAAWKVIDLLLDTALEVANQKPPNNARNWRIEEKLPKAKAREARPTSLSAQAWDALMATYVATYELRHSLVHRSVYTDAANAIVGRTRGGALLRPLAPVEQEALARAALRAADLVIAPVPDPRVEADLLRNLADLNGVHSVTLPAVQLGDSLPEITVIIGPDPNTPGNYLLDVPALSRHRPPSGYADLIVTTPDRPGQQLTGRLENAPDREISIDFDQPPAWLS